MRGFQRERKSETGDGNDSCEGQDFGERERVKRQMEVKRDFSKE